MNYRTISILFILSLFLASCNTNSKIEETDGLITGSKVENFTATDQNGIEFNLYDELKDNKIVLIFYRGQWCPICNKHLRKLQDSLEYIRNEGARVIAVSPEKPNLLNLSKEKSNAEFTFLYDENYRISKMFEVVFSPDSKEVDAYNEHLEADLENAHSDGEELLLPVPATYIIDSDAIIKWRHFDTDYKKRSFVSDILQNL